MLSVYPRYGRLGASSRLRHFAFLPALTEAGIQWRVHSFFRDQYLHKLYASGNRSALEFARSFLSRGRDLLRFREGPLWIEYEPLPGLTPAMGASLLKGRKYVLSFDDAVWAKHDPGAEIKSWGPLLWGASGIVVANAFLRKAIGPWQRHMLQLPTAVGLNQYPFCSEEEKYPRFTVVWIGNPFTYRYIKSHADALRAMAKAVPEMELLIVATGKLPPIPGVPMRFVDWNDDAAPELLARAHVGIMPLDDDPFSQGKSAFKLIQYTAAGIPSIASPVGENSKVIRDGETGFLARTPDEWAEALRVIAADPNLRIRMGEIAHDCAGEYDIAAAAPQLIRFLRERLEL